MRTRFIALILTAFGLAAGAANEAQAQTFTQGWVEVDIGILLVTPVPSGNSVFCSATIGTTETGTSGVNSQSDTGYTTATITAGNPFSTASCKVSIPYGWMLATPTSDTVTASYTVTIAATSGTPVVRSGDHSFPNIPVPPNGVSHVFTANTEL